MSEIESSYELPSSWNGGIGGAGAVDHSIRAERAKMRRETHERAAILPSDAPPPAFYAHPYLLWCADAQELPARAAAKRDQIAAYERGRGHTVTHAVIGPVDERGVCTIVVVYQREETHHAG